MLNLRGLVDLYTREHGQLFPSIISREGEQEKLSWRMYCLYSYPSSHNSDFSNSNLPDLHQPQNQQVVFDSIISLSDTAINSILGEFYSSSTELAPLLAVTGKETAFDRDTNREFKNLPEELILFVSNSHQEIDFRSSVDLVVTQSSNEKVSFSPPRDKDHDFAVMFADGEIRVLTKDIPDSVLTQFVTIAGASEANREIALEPYSLRIR